MQDYLYAAYETRSSKELCLGVWGSMEALARGMRISVKSAWCNFYRSLKGRKHSVSGFAIRRVYVGDTE